MPLKKCPDCGRDISTRAAACPHCGAPQLTDSDKDELRRMIQQQQHPTRETKRPTAIGNVPIQATVLALVGSAALLIGVFAPIVQLPFMGTLNYFRNGKGDGVIVLGFAIISLFVILVQKPRFLWFTGFGSLGMLVYTMIVLQDKIHNAKVDMERQLRDNPFLGMATAAMETVEIQWGWAVLLVGALLIIGAALVYEVRRA